MDFPQQPEQIKQAFDAVITRVEEAAHRVDEEKTADAFWAWAERLRNARDMWEEETADEDPNDLTGLVLAAIDATIVCSASTPEGVAPDAVAGGLLVQWVGWLSRLDPGYAQRVPEGPIALSRKIALEWALPENTDRATAETAFAIDQAASKLLCEAPQTERDAVERATAILADQLQGRPAPYSTALVFRHRLRVALSAKRVALSAKKARLAEKRRLPVTPKPLAEAPGKKQPLDFKTSSATDANTAIRVGTLLMPLIPIMRRDPVVRGIAEAVLAGLTASPRKNLRKPRKSRRG